VSGLGTTFLILLAAFLFIGVPLMYYMVWGLDWDPGLATAIGFAASFIVGVLLLRFFKGERIMKVRGGGA
jgi:uncharacterized integral membrane protein